jgi:hypothetical protein
MRQTEEVRVLLVGLAVVLAASALAAPPAAIDPWTIVPPFPNGWYSAKDDFVEKLAAAKEANSKALDRQTKINDDLGNRVKALGPAEIQSRMQSFMMENPEEAMKMMQQNQAVGDKFTDAQLKSESNRQALEGELKDLQARYKTALENARAPIDLKFKELDVRAQKDLVAVGESWTYAPWAVKEYDALVGQWNAASVKVYGDWWSSSGSFPSWLKRYREHLIQDQVPTREEADNVGAGFMVHLVDTPEASFKSTATLDAVRQYIEQIAQVYGKRESAPMGTMSAKR